MRTMTPRLALMVMVAGLGCGGGDSNGPGGGGNGKVTLEASRAATDSIGAGGGTLSATGSNGVSYALTFPAGALETPTRVTMTPVKAISGLPVTQLAGAVDLEPSGLKLAKPAVLRMVNAGAPGAGLASLGFIFEGDADSVAADLVQDSSGVLSVLVQHFSGSGVAFATLPQIQTLASPGTAGNQSQTYINQLVLLALQSPRDFTAEVAVMRAWMDSVIVPGLTNATSDVQLILAVGDYNLWTQTQIAFATVGSDPVFQPERDLAAAAALSALQHAVADNNTICTQREDLDFANNVLFWQTVAEDFGLATGVNGLDRATVLAGLCIQVRLTDTTLADPVTPNQTQTLNLLAGLQYGTNPLLANQLFSWRLDITGSTADGTVQGASDNAGGFVRTIVPTGQAPLTILVKACLFAAEVPYLDVCASGFLVRNFACNQVFQGDVSVFGQTDLAPLANVRKIDGGLNLFGGTSVVDLPCLAEITSGIFVTGSRAWLSPGILHLPALTSVSGSVQIGGTGLVSADLGTATLGDLDVGGADLLFLAVGDIDGPNTDLGIVGTLQLPRIDLGGVNVGRAIFQFNHALHTLTIGALTTGRLIVQGDSVLTTLTIGPSTVGELDLRDNTALTNLNGISSSTDLNTLFFTVDPGGISEAAALALANRITVRGGVCMVDQNFNQVKCYTGPPWQ